MHKHHILINSSQAGVRFEWFRDGTLVPSDEGSLVLSSIELDDNGQYSCQAILSNGTVLGRVNAGRLTVFGK